MKSGITKIPRQLIINSGKLLGLLFYSLAIPHRRLVRRNLQFCYPEWSAKEIRELSRRIFMNFGITLVEMLQCTFMSHEEVLNALRVEGEENFNKAFKSNRGIVIVSAHMGNWEVGLHITNYYGKPMLGVAAKTRYGWADIFLSRSRNRLGNTIIDKKGALPKITEGLRRGEVIGMLIDQSRRKHGVEVTFFGRKATASPAAALLALRCNSLVLPAFCVRRSDGQLTIQVKTPFELTRTGDLRSDIQSNTQRMIDVVEEMVRTYPDQWFWLLKPWKVHYPNLYSEWDARRRKRKAKKKRKALSKV
jgi:KDO2-lipid IV(A) lauroyltransferase